MATNGAAIVPHRHALGLPAGSVRAMLALGVLGYLWLLLQLMITQDAAIAAELLIRQEASLSFVYMNILMVLMLSHFFSAHGHTIGGNRNTSSPLWLPRGTLRFLILVGYLSLAVWSYRQREAFKLPDNAPILLMLTILIASFSVGFVLTVVIRFISGGRLPPWILDIQAWFALLALVLLGVVLLVRLVINTSVNLESQIGLVMPEAILAGIVGFYFGSRS
ncbi:MAG: hypothetical protein EBV06_05295 [Planctomycetia bacterium]|nr:hypothetical protein [Planctomycetia bacterium]